MIFAILPYIMKETLREKIWESLPAIEYEQVYINPGLGTLIAALEHTLHNKKIAILFNDDVPRSSFWQPLPILPETAASLIQMRKVKATLSKWSELFPHLIRPIKTVYGFYNHSNGYLKMADTLLGHSGSELTRAAVLSEIPYFGKYFLKNTSGWLFSEILVNIPRLKIGLLREIFERGGCVLNFVETTTDKGGIHLRDKQSSQTVLIKARKVVAEPETATRPAYLYARSPWFQFAMRLNYETHKLTFYEHEESVIIETTPIGSDQEMRKMISIFLGNNPKTIGLVHLPGDESVHLIKHFPKIFNEIRPVSPNGGSAHPPLEDYLETAYDLAKQTGITFTEFRSLYLKYGACTNWFTDRTYEWMPVLRNSHRLWRQAEQEFITSYEWGIPKTSDEAEIDLP